MNKKILNKILEKKKEVIPYLFTERQIKILEKYKNEKKLTNTEKTYLYSAIKKKIDALSGLQETLYITGDMIKSRLNKARELLRELKGEAFVSGSFLFKEKYNDIDIYIISNRRKQYHKGKKHFIFIAEKDLKKPIFTSAAKYSVSNFFIEIKNPEIKRPSYNDLIVTYEMAVNEVLDNDEQKAVRDLVFEYYLQIKSEVLDSFTLFKKTKEIIDLKVEERINIINKITKELLIKSYSNKYLYNELVPFIKRIKESISEIKANENLTIYYDFLNGVKNECRRIKI